MKDPLDLFFGLGDKVTKGNPQRKADFDYYMLWIIFLAFLVVFGTYIHSFIVTMEFGKLGWAVVIFGILWFQYYNLKNVRDTRKIMKSMPKSQEKEEKIETIDDMIRGFNKKE